MDGSQDGPVETAYDLQITGERKTNKFDISKHWTYHDPLILQQLQTELHEFLQKKKDDISIS